MNERTEVLGKSDKTPLKMPERIDVYTPWLEAQKIPIFRGYFIQDINELELAYWDLKGAPACFVLLEGTGGMNDAYVCEIPPGGKTKPLRHLYEEMVYVTKGHGSTTVWQKDGRKHSFEWGAGSLFAIPLNATYQHFNASGIEGARFYSVTNCCFLMNLFHSVDFIFNNEYAFTDRFDPSTSDYFGAPEELSGRMFLTTNFVPDVNAIKLYDYSERGEGGTGVKFNLAGQSMGSHVSEFPIGTYKKSHRHGPGAHLIIVNGQGYSLMWTPSGERMRFEWQPGTVIVPPDQWFHQHFNTGRLPARYLALHRSNWRFKSAFRGAGDVEAASTSVKDGGNQIEYEDEDPAIHREFLAELEKSGADCLMCDYFSGCPKP
jgi:oxalate decarboxylase/phosphoglucose isomerase-like protein (cupin superfamily)